MLSVSLGPVMGDAEHLAVVRRVRAALAPGRHVVGVHLLEIVNPALVGIEAERAQRAVGGALGLGGVGLLRVGCFLDGSVEDPDVEQFRVGAAA